MGKINGKVALFAVLLAVILLPGVFAAGDVAYTLPYDDPLPPCYNGIKDANETGVDCGPACIRLDVRETCDTIDNDRDCLIDENCPGNPGIGAPGGVGGSGTPLATQPLPYETQPVSEQSCSDGIQNQDESYIDCGGVCTLNVKEICYDGLDNNNDCIFEDGCYRECLSDEKGNCLEVIRTSPPDDGNFQPIEQETTESSTSPEQQPVSYPAQRDTISYPAQMGTPAEEIPATPAPTPDELAALTDEQIDAFIEQNGGADFINQVRKLADDKGIYVPKGESDAQFGRKYVRYFFKHQSELAAKFEGKEQTEDDFVGILKQFSEETYPKPVQQQSFFSKVAGFFKGLFS